MTTLLHDDAVVSAAPIATERLLWLGPLTIATSVVAVHVVRLVSLVVNPVPDGMPMSVSLGWIAPTADTVILCGLAVLVFAMLAGFSDAPVQMFQRVAFGALLASFLPLLIMGSGGLDGSASMAITLAAMHVAAYIPCVTLLPRLATVRSPERMTA